MMNLKNNYYISSFFWSTSSKLLNAVFNFLAVPLLLGLYGKADYGLLAIATSCNGYMHLLDFGMNTGAVKFFSQWRTEGNVDMIRKVGATNTTFYLIVGVINILGLIALAIWGEPLFNISHPQFLILRQCLLIIALFSIFSWSIAPFSQLLTAYKQMAFVMQMESLLPLLKIILICFTLYFQLPMIHYFFGMTLILSSLLIPYAWRCLHDGIIKTLMPKWFWGDFKIVLIFSLSIFVLSLFRVTATQSRPILLSMFANDGAEAVAEYNIISVFPTFIIMLSGTFSSIFLPQASELVTHRNQRNIENFAYKWTTLSTLVVNILCIPFILGAQEVLKAYVGTSYVNLSLWLILWIATVLIQMHTTAGDALILAYGHTRPLVITSAIACTSSVVLNIVLCPWLQVGAAVVSYLFYVVIVIGVNYTFLYKHLLQLSRFKMLTCFLKPTFVGAITLAFCSLIPFDIILGGSDNRWESILSFCMKGFTWLIIYILCVHLFHILPIQSIFKRSKHVI